MRFFYLYTILFGLVFGLSGCLKTRDDVKDAEESKLLQTQVSSMQKANADYVSRVEETLENYRALNGRVEVLENKLEKTEGADSDKQSGNAKAITEINDKLKLLQEAFSKLQEENQAMQADITAFKSNKPVKSDVGPASVGGGGDTHAGVFANAEELFKDKKWKEAILQYDEYKKKSPKGKAIAEAIYKTGVCFQELGMKDEAKVFYQEVTTKFPKSDFARKAQIRLKSI